MVAAGKPNVAPDRRSDAGPRTGRDRAMLLVVDVDQCSFREGVSSVPVNVT